MITVGLHMHCSTLANFFRLRPFEYPERVYLQGRIDGYFYLGINEGYWHESYWLNDTYRGG